MSWGQSGYRFLDALIAGDWASAREPLQSLDPPYETFMDFVGQQDLAPYLHWRLHPEGFSALPGWVRLAILPFKAHNDQLRGPLLSLLRELLERCPAEQFLLLKGPQLGQRLYGSIAARRMVDLDLLAAPDSLSALREELLAMGFIDEYRALYPRRLIHHFVHAQPMQRGSLNIDLHATLRVRPAYRLSPDTVWRDRVACSFDSISVNAPSDEHNLLLALLSVAGDLELAKLRAKSLVDLQAAAAQWEQNGDWDSFLERRRPENLEALVSNVLLLMTITLPASSHFPGLANALQKRQALLRPLSREQAMNLLLAPPYSSGNRSWFLSIYPGNRLAYLAWLALGIPAKQNLGKALSKALKAGRGRTADE